MRIAKLWMECRKVGAKTEQIIFSKLPIGKTPPRAEKQWFVDGSVGMPWLSISDMGNAGVYVFNTSEGLTSDAVQKYNMKVVPAGTVFVSFKLQLVVLQLQ